MIPKKLAPAKAGVADFSDKIMRQGKEISPFSFFLRSGLAKPAIGYSYMLA